MSTERQKEVENNIQIISDGNFDANELWRHVKRIDDCKRILDDSRDKEVAKECFTKKSANRSRSSVSEAESYKKLCGEFTETEDDEFVMRRVFQLARGSKKEQSILLVRCTARRHHGGVERE